jgi:hypothetical protein
MITLDIIMIITLSVQLIVACFSLAYNLKELKRNTKILKELQDLTTKKP